MMKLKSARGTHTRIDVLKSESAGNIYLVMIPDGGEREFVELEFYEYEYDAFISQLINSRNKVKDRKRISDEEMQEYLNPDGVKD